MIKNIIKNITNEQVFQLKFIKLGAYELARYIQIYKQQSHRYRYLYFYCLQQIFTTIFEAFILIVLSILLGTFKETVLVSFSFILMRGYAGGMHLNSYSKCAHITWITFIIAGLIAKYMIIFFKFMGVYTIWSLYNKQIIFLVFSTIMGIYVLYAPAEHKNRSLSKSEKLKFKKIAITILMSLFILQLAINNNVVSISFTVGITLSGIIATPIANRFCK
jgi:accessory gene regulator B